MEKLKTVPFYKRFGLRVLLFDAIILLSIISTTVIIGRQNYKTLTDRISFHTALFADLVQRLGSLNEREWPGAISSFPGVLPQQRICVFTVDRRLIYDSGIMRAYAPRSNLLPFFPDPYVDWARQDHHFDPAVLIRYLRHIDLHGVDPRKLFISTRTVPYPRGLDRILLSGKLVTSASGRPFILVMTDSVVDILIHNRGIKERFLIVYTLAILLSLLLTLLLSRSVTNPLKRLYAYSRQVLASRWNPPNPMQLPTRGEIGEICRALQSVINEQKRRSESFARFSSDVVHELKTPLAAIRSGLDVCSETHDEGLIEEVYGRITRRIAQMENVMDEIRIIGNVESTMGDDHCGRIAEVCDEVLYEFNEAEIGAQIDREISYHTVSVSCERLYQVVANLLRNAMSFSPRSGSVALIVEAGGGFLAIRVRDRGPGIAEEVFDHIADRFFTFRPDGSEKHSGLGLAIVDAIARSCGGRLEYRNRPEGGAEFTCTLPFRDAPRTPPETVPPTEG